MLQRACEHFIGRSEDEIEDVLQQTLEGHLRSIVGQLTVEEIYQDREKFASEVREQAKPDVARMGIEILSFVIQDLRDEVDYLTSIGKSRTAEVVKDANIGTTNAERDARIQEAICDQERNDAKMKADTNVDNAKRTFETTQAECETRINKAKTEAALAYDLQVAKEEQGMYDYIFEG